MIISQNFKNLAVEKQNTKQNAVHFGAMQVSQFKGDDLRVVTSLGAPINKFNEHSDFNKWCISQIKKVAQAVQGNKTAEARVNDCMVAISRNDGTYTPASALLFLSKILQDLGIKTNFRTGKERYVLIHKFFDTRNPSNKQNLQRFETFNNFRNARMALENTPQSSPEYAIRKSQMSKAGDKVFEAWKDVIDFAIKDIDDYQRSTQGVGIKEKYQYDDLVSRCFQAIMATEKGTRGNYCYTADDLIDCIHRLGAENVFNAEEGTANYECLEKFNKANEAVMGNVLIKLVMTLRLLPLKERYITNVMDVDSRVPEKRLLSQISMGEILPDEGLSSNERYEIIRNIFEDYIDRDVKNENAKQFLSGM